MDEGLLKGRDMFNGTVQHTAAYSWRRKRRIYNLFYRKCNDTFHHWTTDTEPGPLVKFCAFSVAAWRISWSDRRIFWTCFSDLTALPFMESILFTSVQEHRVHCNSALLPFKLASWENFVVKFYVRLWAHWLFLSTLMTLVHLCSPPMAGNQLSVQLLNPLVLLSDQKAKLYQIPFCHLFSASDLSNSLTALFWSHLSKLHPLPEHMQPLFPHPLLSPSLSQEPSDFFGSVSPLNPILLSNHCQPALPTGSWTNFGSLNPIRAF